MGDSNFDVSPAALDDVNRIANLQSGLGQQLFSEATPLRQNLLGSTLQQIGFTPQAPTPAAMQQYQNELAAFNARTNALQSAAGPSTNFPLGLMTEAQRAVNWEHFDQNPNQFAFRDGLRGVYRRIGGSDDPNDFEFVPDPRGVTAQGGNAPFANQGNQDALAAHLANAPVAPGTTYAYTGGPLGFDTNVSADALANSSIYQALKSTAEREFNQSRDRILESMPTGGRLAAALGDVGADRAATLTQGMGALATDELARRERAFQNASQRAVALATGVTGLGTQSVAGAGNTFANIMGAQLQANAIQRQAEAEEKGGMGEAVGVLGSSVIGNLPF